MNNDKKIFVSVWEFRVAKQHRTQFERRYGPAGDWVNLFRRARGYIRTDFLRDIEDKGQYITVDYWASRQAFVSFRKLRKKEFEELDAFCEALTTRELLLGYFTIRVK